MNKILSAIKGVVAKVNTNPSADAQKSGDKTKNKATSSAEASKKPHQSHIQGEWGEKVAEEYLIREKGLKTVARRVKLGYDEIDLIMEPKKSDVPQLIFVEVKTRKTELFGGGLAAMDNASVFSVNFVPFHSKCP